MLSLQISRTFWSGKEDRKGEEDHNDYPADFSVMLKCNCAVSLVYSFAAKFEMEILGPNTEPLIPTQQLDTVCRSLICPQSRLVA